MSLRSVPDDHGSTSRPMRVCPICSASLDDLRKRRDAIYCSGRCRAEASHRRLASTRQRTDAHRKRTRRQRGRNQRVRRTPDLRISYRKAVKVAMTLMGEAAYGVNKYPWPQDAEARAAEAMAEALTERQRAALDRREVRT